MRARLSGESSRSKSPVGRFAATGSFAVIFDVTYVSGLAASRLLETSSRGRDRQARITRLFKAAHGIGDGAEVFQ